MLGLEIIAEAVGRGFHDREAVDVGLRLARVAAPTSEPGRHIETGVLRRFLDRRGAGHDDDFGQRERPAQLVDLAEALRQLARLLDRPSLPPSDPATRPMVTSAT